MSCLCGSGSADEEPRDRHWAPQSLPEQPPLLRTYARARSLRSTFITMSDGVKIAVDVTLPLGYKEGERVDCVVASCRYGRSWRLRWPLKALVGGNPVDAAYFMFKPLWVNAGLAAVSFDVRGTGASYGRWEGMWSEREQLDATEVLDWVQKQSWSSSRALLFGQSYDAVACLHTVARRHPAVLGCVAVNPFLDIYKEVVQPGGIRQFLFTKGWSGLVAALDNQRPLSAPGQAKGVCCIARGFARAQPLDPEEDAASPPTPPTPRTRRQLRTARAAALAAALLERVSNYSAMADVKGISFADDMLNESKKTSEEISFSSDLAALSASRTPICWVTGWFDASSLAGTAGFAATKDTPGTELVVGPWTHMLWQHVRSSRAGSGFTAFSVPKETLRYMLNLVRTSRETASATTDPPAPAPAPPSDRVHLFEQGASGRGWLAYPDWPTTSSLELRLSAGHSLQEAAAGAEPSEPAGRDEMVVRAKRAALTGFSRWQAMMNVGSFVVYKGLDRLPLRYTGAALATPLHICGCAVVSLFLDSSDGRADVFAYLIDVEPGGRLRYVAEGCLRSSHRTEHSGDAAGETLSALLTPQTAPPLLLHTFRRADEAPPLPPPGEPGGGEKRQHGGPTPPQILRVAMRPAAYVFGVGHRVALGIAGGDAKHFEPDPEAEGRRMGVHFQGAHISMLQLPVIAV